MPRLHQVTRDEVDPPMVTAMYDLLFGDRDAVVQPGTATGSPGDGRPTLADSPDVFEHAVQGFGLDQSPPRQLEPVPRELGQTR